MIQKNSVFFFLSKIEITVNFRIKSEKNFISNLQNLKICPCVCTREYNIIVQIDLSCHCNVRKSTLHGL